MSKVDPTKLNKLDRRSTILLQAARSQTEMAEKDPLHEFEEPGVDALRGGFGAFGSIIRARSARRASMASRASSNPYRARPPGAMDPLAGMTRHQLYDPPVAIGREAADDISLRSQSQPSTKPGHSFVDMASPSPRQQTIKFGEEQVTHLYPADRTKGGLAPTHMTTPVPEQRASFLYDDPYSDDHAIDDSSLRTPGRKPGARKYPGTEEEEEEERVGLVRAAEQQGSHDAEMGVRLVQKRSGMI